MKKKVLFVIDSLNCGGAEKSLLSLISKLSKTKYDISLWVLSHNGVLLPLVNDDINLLDEPRYNLFERVKFFIARSYFSITIRINKLFHVKEHLAETKWKCMGWAYKVPAGIWDVVIAYQQGFPTYLVADKIYASKKNAWINADIFSLGYNIKFNKPFYNKFQSIVPVSSRLMSLINDKMPEFSQKCTVVYDILNSDYIRSQAKEDIKSLKQSSDEWILVTTGRLVAPKGYDIALKAAKILKDVNIPFKWYIIGEGEERINIEKLRLELGLINEVVLLGLQTNPYKYMAQADIYVQTSRSEGFGLTIGEAKILGKPIISTNFDVVYDQINHEKNGLIADMTAQSVADSILRIINNDKLREMLVESVNNEINQTSVTEVLKVEYLIDNTNED